MLNARTSAALAMLAALAAAPALHAQTDPMVGGAAMSPQMTIVQNASAAPNLSTLVAAVKAAGLVDTLSSAGPFTVFAPVNDAFAALPAGTVETLLKPENKDQLVKVLTYHVVAGTHPAKEVIALARKGGTLTTVEGEPLTLSLVGGKVVITDAHGGKATVTTANVYQSNGVVHVIDHVLLP